MRTLHVLLAALALAVAGPALADKGGKGKDKDHGERHHPASGGHKDEGVKGGKKFGSGEREHIVAYFNAHPAERAALPPGLAKQGKIPPGWQKKIRRGERIPDDVWAFHVRLPHEVIGLPPPPPGVVHVRIHDHVIKVVEQTHEVLDHIGLPHPPTPRR